MASGLGFRVSIAWVWTRVFIPSSRPLWVSCVDSFHFKLVQLRGVSGVQVLTGRKCWDIVPGARWGARGWRIVNSRLHGGGDAGRELETIVVALLESVRSHFKGSYILRVEKIINHFILYTSVIYQSNSSQKFIGGMPLYRSYTHSVVRTINRNLKSNRVPRIWELITRPDPLLKEQAAIYISQA